MYKQAETQHSIDCVVDTSEAGLRIDQVLSNRFPEHSRGRWQAAIKNGDILLNGEKTKSKSTVFPSDTITGTLNIMIQTENQAQAIALDILYQDEDIIVLNKPAGLVVHPAAGNPDGTLLNALLHHFPENANLPRAGIVHRLDKDTSGVMVVAHSLTAHTHLIQQLQTRTMGREYLALVHRYVTAGDTIDAPIGRHPKERLKMAITANGKPAITHYRIEERFDETTLIRVKLETGRTHQIRVHLSEHHYPLVGDSLYHPGYIPSKTIPEPARTALKTFPRQALHAETLRLHHPNDHTLKTFSAPLPEDMQNLLETLRQSSHPINK
ncbi:23S rRNA pseudouridine(1911/1915/1917) synthase RluD [Suttonella ornithocola]|uniref:Pseudouridine synthase n=1 Tax=Suttonella ornithocola TaxID=279832 RepID=A0A380MS70_9GAMM|nr:23S rRNA pseudouridine(1911/1915/1917) synthase RluD [Suttonella ornithocola]SUO94187.1 Ribosomal large subunit pseudouridine synthase D [Suttonella ornithocola]